MYTILIMQRIGRLHKITAWTRRRRNVIALALAVIIPAGVLSGCGSSNSTTVYAAASLQEAFPAIDSSATYSFGGSDKLATQIEQGAPADVFASASAKYTTKLYEEGLVDKPVTFASNRLVLIVPKANPANITKVSDVTRPGTRLVVAAAGVPVGDYTRTVLGELKLSDALKNVVSEESDVKGVTGKIAVGGNAHAGFVYATDVPPVADKVRVIEIPASAQPPISYQIAVVKRTKHPKEAAAFIAKVTDSAGQEALSAAGFVPVSK